MGMFQVYYLHSSVASNIVLTVPHCHGHPAILRVSTVCIGCTRICNHHATRASLYLTMYTEKNAVSSMHLTVVKTRSSISHRAFVGHLRVCLRRDTSAITLAEKHLLPTYCKSSTYSCRVCVCVCVCVCVFVTVCMSVCLCVRDSVCV
jgi:hypothetical protein